MSVVYGNMVGSSGSILGKTVEILSDDGVDLMGVVVDQETVLTAKPSDVRIGKIAATESGIIEGTNTINYRTERGVRVIKPGESFSIYFTEDDYDQYNYTQLQCMIAPFNTSISDSYAINKIVINDGVYMTESTNKISDVTKNSETKSIDLNITNDSDVNQFIYFFTYKEEEE